MKINFKMENKVNVEIAEKPNYEKPLFEESNGMAFTKEIWDKFNGGRFCIQCSGCHGCR
jgi:hypothetical protein